MHKEDINIHDWTRIIMGEVPASFFIEVIIRTSLIYLIIMVALRLMGSRMAGQLNRIEQASLVTLAAAIGVPIQSPERGIVPPVIIALIVIITGRWIARRAYGKVNFERKVLGNVTVLIKDGVIDMDALKRTTMTRERIFAQLRSKQILQLGQIKRFYMEANGRFTLIRQQEETAGLDIVPDNDNELKEALIASDKTVCFTCGATGSIEKNCYRCGDNRTAQGVRSTIFKQ